MSLTLRRVKGTTLTHDQMDDNLVYLEGHVDEHKHDSLFQPDGTNEFVYTDNAGVLHIDGDIVQNGSSYSVQAESVTTTQNLIVTRSDAIAGIPVGETSGLEVTLYDGVSNLTFGTDNDGYFKVGEEGELQILATREDAPNSTSIAFWNDTEKRFDTSSNLTWDGSVVNINGNNVIIGQDEGSTYTAVSSIIRLTQSEYDAITPDSDTLYIIKD